MKQQNVGAIPALLLGSQPRWLSPPPSPLERTDKSKRSNTAGRSTHHPPPREPKSREVNPLFFVQLSCPRAFQRVGITHPQDPSPRGAKRILQSRRTVETELHPAPAKDMVSLPKRPETQVTPGLS